MKGAVTHHRHRRVGRPAQLSTARVERPPEIAATAQGCHVSVTVEDDGEIDDVRLHWRDGGDRVTARWCRDGEIYAGDLPAADGARPGASGATDDARQRRPRPETRDLPPGAC